MRDPSSGVSLGAIHLMLHISTDLPSVNLDVMRRLKGVLLVKLFTCTCFPLSLDLLCVVCVCVSVCECVCVCVCVSVCNSCESGTHTSISSV